MLLICLIRQEMGGTLKTSVDDSLWDGAFIFIYHKWCQQWLVSIFHMYLNCRSSSESISIQLDTSISLW